MKLTILIIFCALFAFVLTVNDYIFTNLTCHGASGYAEVNVCESQKKQGFMEAEFLRPFSNFKVSINFFLKRGSNFIEVFKTPPIDWCKFVDGKAQLMSFQKLLIKSLQNASPHLIHPCPYVGMQIISNATAPKDVVEILPQGTFKVILKMFDKIEKSLFKIVVHADVVKLS
ncbi:hypothetical protein ACKWTF_003800 [Chironomus riparius]